MAIYNIGNKCYFKSTIVKEIVPSRLHIRLVTDAWDTSTHHHEAIGEDLEGEQTPTVML